MQDASLQESMGPIQDRTRENLCSTDNGIVLTRRLLLKAAKDNRDGKPLPGLDPATQRVRSCAIELPRNVHFQGRRVGRAVPRAGYRSGDRLGRTADRMTGCRQLPARQPYHPDHCRDQLRNVQTAPDPVHLGLRPHARARRRLGAAGGHRAERPRAAGRGDVLPDGAQPRVRRRGAVDVVVHRVAAPRSAAVRRDSGRSSRAISAIRASSSRRRAASASRRT